MIHFITAHLHRIISRHILISLMIIITGLSLAASQNADAQSVRSFQKISSTQGVLAGPLDDFDDFGESLKSIGDLDGDGEIDLAVGVRSDADGIENTGAVYILFLNTDGTVKTEQKSV